METTRTANATARTANANTQLSPRSNVTVNRTGNISGTTAQAGTAQQSAPIVNNWQNVSGQNYTAFRDYRRQWHDRSWWDSNYSNIILVSGLGWWYWNAGYWYPAWGYDPYYSYYPYDGPIYGYNNLSPDRIIVTVQTQLRNDGYYAGRVDGILGPQTRHAIAAFQADHGLAVTSAVDEPTLATLGLT
jgi:lysozyme family protein